MSALPEDTVTAPTAPEALGDDGVDVTLIRWMLSLSPLERLAVLQDFADGVLALRRGGCQPQIDGSLVRR